MARQLATASFDAPALGARVSRAMQQPAQSFRKPGRAMGSKELPLLSGSRIFSSASLPSSLLGSSGSKRSSLGPGPSS
jgi:hypothetical protein